MSALSLDDLKLFAKSRGIKGYKNITLSKLKIDNERWKKIR